MTPIRRLAAMLALLALAPGLPSQEDPGANKEVQVILREQENALRRVKSLRVRIAALAERMRSEGRLRSAELLAEALQRLDALEIETSMADVAEKIRTGQAYAGLAQAQRVVAEIQTLIDLLLERRSDPEQTDARQKALDQAAAELEEIADTQRSIQERTNALRDALSDEERRRLAEVRAAVEELRARHARQRGATDRAFGESDRVEDALQAARRLREEAALASARHTTSPRRDRLLEALIEAGALKEAVATLARETEALSALEEARQALAGSATRLAQRERGSGLSDRDRTSLERAAGLAAAAARAAREAAARLSDEAEAAASEGLPAEVQEHTRAVAAQAQQAAEAAAQAADRARTAADRAAAGGEDARSAAEGALWEARAAMTEAEARVQALAHEASARARATSGKARGLAGKVDGDDAAPAETRAGEALRTAAAALEESARNTESGTPVEAEREAKAALAAIEAAARHLMDAAREAGPAGEGSVQSLAEAAAAAQASAAALAGQAGDSGARAEAAKAAAAALAQAAASAQAASSSEAGGQAAAGEQAAAAAQEAALAEARIAALAEQAGPDPEKLRRLAEEELDLSRKVEEAEQAVARSGATRSRDAADAGEALREAREAMSRASPALAGGAGEEARSSQAQAGEALDRAAEALRRAEEARPRDEAADRAEAERLAREQEALEERTKALAESIKNLSEAGSRSAASAASSMAEASQRLQRNDPGGASPKEQEALDRLEEAREEIEEEKARYRSLQQEEALFQIKVLIDKLIERQEPIHAETRRIADEAKGDRPSRAQRRQLARLGSQQEESEKIVRMMSEGIRKEQEERAGTSLAFAWLLNEVALEMGRLVQDFQKGNANALTVATSESVLRSLQDLRQALEDEMDSRRRQQQQGEGNQDSRPSLVGLVAELKLVKRLQANWNADSERFWKRSPRLGPDGDPVDQVFLERLAARQNSIRSRFESIMKAMQLAPDEGSGPPENPR
jgi:hypothetical protein